MSTINAPVQNVGLYPDAVNPVQKNPYGSSVESFSKLMAPLDPVVPVGSGGPANHTTDSDALREMMEFMRGNAETQFAMPGATPSASATIPTPQSATQGLDIQTGSDRKASASTQANGANGPAAIEGALPKVQVAALQEKKASPPTFFQSLRRSFSSRG